MYTRKTPIILVVTIMLLAAGGLSRWVRVSRAFYAMELTPLSQSLTTLPLSIGDYKGKDIPLSLEVLDAANVDSYVHREYFSQKSRLRFGVYIGYWGRENTGMSHGPEVCYPASGWSIDQPATEVPLPVSNVADKKTIKIAMHRFVRADPEGIRRRAVGFVAIIGGQFHSSSVGFFWHEPRSTSSGSVRYLAQVHVSAIPERGGWDATESDILVFMESLIPELSEILPGMDNSSDN